MVRASGAVIDMSGHTIIGILSPIPVATRARSAPRRAALARKPRAPELLPRYREIGNQLMADISEGVYPVGGFLPPEIELCRKYRISRFTAREALRQLAEAGLVSRRQGSGTQVVAVPGAAKFVQQVGSVQDLTQYARTTELQIVYTGKIALNRLLARQFKAKAGEEWLFAAGIRVDREPGARGRRPICITRIYLNPVLDGIQERLRTREGAIYELIESAYGLRIARVEQQIAAVSLDRDDAVSLDEARGAPALRTLRLYYDESERLLEATESIHPGDRFAYTMNLKRGTP
jgi:DNA-binding GntR family transcriptional regulator